MAGPEDWYAPAEPAPKAAPAVAPAPAAPQAPAQPAWGGPKYEPEKKAAQVLGGVTLYDKDDKPVVVEAHDAPAKILSGEYGYKADTLVPIKVNGVVNQIPAANLKKLQGVAGVTTATGHELKQAELQRDYGDFGHAAEAYAVNTLDSASLGMSNFLVGGLGGDEVKEHLRKVNEANPNAAIAGQLTGIIAPIAADVLTGGLATPVVGADIAATVARLGLKGEQAAEAARLIAQGGKAIKTAEELSVLAKGAAEARGLGTAAEAMDVARLAGEAPSAVGAGERLLGAGKTLATGAGKAVAGPTRAVEYVGKTVENLFKEAVGPEATSFAGKLAQKAIPATAKTAAEGALYGAGSVLGQQSLEENPDYFGEKMLHGIGYGALMGGAIGAGTAGLGAVGRKVLGANAERFAEGADKAIVGAVDREGKFAQAIDDLPGGRSALRKMLLGGEAPLVRAGDNIQGIAPKVSDALKAQEAAMPTYYARLDQAGRDMVEHVGHEVRQGPTLASLEKIVADTLTPPKVSAMERAVEPNLAAFEKAREAALGDLRAAGGLDTIAAHAEPAGPKTTQVPRTQAEQGKFLGENIKDPKVLDFINNPDPHKAVPDWLKFETKVEEKVAGKAKPKPGTGRAFLEEPRLTYAQTAEYIQKVKAIAENPENSARIRSKYEELAKSLTANLEADAQEKFFSSGRGKELFELLQKGGDRASVDAVKAGQGGQARAELLEYGTNLLTLRQLRVANEAAQHSLAVATEKAAPVAQAGLSLGKQALGAGLGSALGTHGLHGIPGYGAALAAAGLVGKIAKDAAKKTWGERGQSAVASFYDKMSTLGGAVEIAGAVQKERDALIREISERTGRSRSAAPGIPAAELGGKDLAERYQSAVDKVLEYAVSENSRAHVQATAGQLAPYSAGAARAFELAALRTTQYLVNALPKPRIAPDSMYPKADKHAASDAEMARWLRVYEVAHNPNVVLKHVSKGIVPTQAEVDAWYAMAPASAQNAANELATNAANADKKPDFATQQAIAAVQPPGKRGRGVPKDTQKALQYAGGAPEHTSKGGYAGGSPEPATKGGYAGGSPERGNPRVSRPYTASSTVQRGHKGW
jgi:hypothetical protein